MIAQLRQKMPEGLEEVVVDPKEMRRIAFRGQAHRYNIKDPFGQIYKAVQEMRRRINKWSDFDFSQSYAEKQSTAICKKLNVLGFVWDAHGNHDPYLLPTGHKWDPTPEQLLELLILNVFDAEDPETGDRHVSGSSEPDEYALRKCIAYHAIECRGSFERLVESRSREEDPPRRRPNREWRLMGPWQSR